ADRSLDRGGVADVGLDQLDLVAIGADQPRGVALDPGPREVVEHPHPRAAFGQSADQVGTDKSGPTEHDDRTAIHATAIHSVNPRLESSRRASDTRSTATCERSHSPSSAKPSANATCGSKPSTRRARPMSA